MQENKVISICFVCLGNICRSPTAEAVMLQRIHQNNLQDRIYIDSAGTAAYHVGEQADARSREHALNRGYHIRSRARQFTKEDLDKFDYVIVMDPSNQQNILRLCTTEEQKQKIYLFRSFEGEENNLMKQYDVPDPYYGGSKGFEMVLDICERCSDGLIDFIYKNTKSNHINPTKNL